MHDKLRTTPTGSCTKCAAAFASRAKWHERQDSNLRVRFWRPTVWPLRLRSCGARWRSPTPISEFVALCSMCYTNRTFQIGQRAGLRSRDTCFQSTDVTGLHYPLLVSDRRIERRPRASEARRRPLPQSLIKNLVRAGGTRTTSTTIPK